MDKKYTSSINRRSPRPRSKRLREQGIGGHVSGAAVAPSGNDFGLQDSLLNFRTGVNTLLVPCDSTGAEITWEEASQLDSDGNIKAKSLKAKVDLWTVGSLAGKGATAPDGSTGGGGGSLFGLYTDTTWVSVPADDDALSAVLGKSLHARVSVLEGAGYLTGITKQMVENVLTGNITTHAHNYLWRPNDNRSVATKPNDYNGKFFFTGMKRRDALNVPGTATYVNGFGWRGWDDASGGYAWEVFGDSADLYVRCGSTTTWEAWRKILTEKTTAELIQLFVTSGADSKIVLNNTDTETKYQNISFRQDGTQYGWLGTTGDDILKWNGYTLLHTNNYASLLDSRYARQAAPNNFVHDGNEVTFVPSGYSAPIWLNYRTVGGTNGAISEYRFGNGSGGAYADVRAKSFIRNGGTASQILMANGTVANKVTLSGVSNAGWTGSADDDLKIPTILFLSRWNGLYNTTSSNLQYCDRGRFGTMAVANAADYLARSGGSMTNTNLVTNLNAELLGGMTNNQVRSSVMRFFGWMQPTSTTNADLNLLTYGMAHNYHAPSKWTNAPSGMGYGAAITFSQYDYDNLYGQLAWDVNHYTADVTGKLFWRAFATASDGTNKWGGWRQIAFTDGTIANATNADKLDGLHATDFTRKSSLAISAGGVAKVTLPESGCLISIRGLNGGRGALVWVTGYYDGTSVRNTARIIYSSSNYAFYFNGASESSGCVYVKSLWSSGTDSVTVTALQGSHPALTSVSAVPSDATLIGSPATLAALTDNVASATNADMLDNLHAIDFARSSRVGNVDLNTLTTSGIYGTGGSCTNAPDKTPWGQLLVLHGQGDTPIAQMMFSYNVNGLVYVRAGSPTNTGGKGSWGAWKQLALIDSNVASATKLQTARNIWGRTFDGTNDIMGEMQDVSAIRFMSGGHSLAIEDLTHMLFSSSGGFIFKSSYNNTALRILSNGRVGVNMSVPAYDFDVTGVIHASGEIFSDKAIGGKGTTSSSDIRQKHIIGDFVMSLDDVLKMPLKRFKWLDGPDKDERIGVIAQEVTKIVPQVVYLKPDGFYGVDYGALAHAEVKTVAKVVVQLVERLNKLEKIVQKLQQKIHA